MTNLSITIDGETIVICGINPPMSLRLTIDDAGKLRDCIDNVLGIILIERGINDTRSDAD